jgi:carbon monoxide dehydrogenase subunit G
METTGQIMIAATPEAAVRALRDPRVLMAVLPSCKGVRPTGPDTFDVDFARDIGPTRIALKTVLTVTTRADGAQVMTIEGRSLVTGTVKAECAMVLAPDGAGTRADYRLTLTLSGMLRRIAEAAAPGTVHVVGQRLMARFAAQAARLR